MQIIAVLYYVIIYSYLQKFFKLGILKTLHNLQENTFVGAYQPAACYFFNKRLRPFWKTVKSNIFTEHLETRPSVFMKDVCNIT